MYPWPFQHGVSCVVCMAQVDIDTVEKFEALREAEKAYFTDMVDKCKASGADLVICQWGFDDEANHLLMHKVGFL
jgi:T-complex protein 1 subunit epsilon